MRYLETPIATQRLTSLVAPIVLGATWLFHALVLSRWLEANVLPNGYQNEIFHLGNALDLWVAWQERDWRLLHHLMFTQYWPPLHYLSAFPMLLFQISRDGFVLANLGFLALLLWSTYALGRRLEGRSVGLLAAVLLSFFPSIYGNLRHFEPNVPLTALVTVSLLALVASHRFSHRGYSVLFGLCAGLTMLVDRLSGAFFLTLPAIYTAMAGLWGGRRHPRARRKQMLGNLGLAVICAAILCGYYYVNFFRFYSEEILPQAVAGEILSTGERSEFREPLAWTSLFFYPNTLIDGQVGFALGLLLSAALLLAISRRERKLRILWVWLGGAFFLFTIIQKKQLYYTIPVLPAFALLAASGLLHPALRRLRPLLLVGIMTIAIHQHQYTSFGKGLFPDRFMARLGGYARLIDLTPLSGRSLMPSSWVAPRYPQSWPPLKEDLKVDEILASLAKLRGDLPQFRVETFSEDQTFFEGYLTFFIRCAHPNAIVNGLLLNPQGFFENIRLMDAFVYVTPSRRRFPTETSIQSMLEARGSLKYAEGLPIVPVLEAHRAKLRLESSHLTSTGVRAHIYGLRPWSDFAPRPTAQPLETNQVHEPLETNDQAPF